MRPTARLAAPAGLRVAARAGSVRPLWLLALLALLALLVAVSACSADSPDATAGPTAGPPSDLASCTPQRLDTVTPGRLTLSSGPVNRPPWVVGGDVGRGTSGDPNDGRGYDPAVGLAVAEQLGYGPDQVSWVATAFAVAIAAGQKDFDLHVEQATITRERRADVDLSEPYYVMRQAVVTVAGRPVATATGLADLRTARLAVLAGSPGEQLLAELDPTQVAPTVLADLDDARGAVSGAGLDALVVDYQTALELDRDETRLVGGELVGLLPRVTGEAEQFGLVMEKDSSLTSCVDAALSSLRADGTLDGLERRWLSEEPGYADLK